VPGLLQCTDSVRARFVSKLVAPRFVSKLIGWRYDALLFNWAVQNRREPASREGGSFAAGAAYPGKGAPHLTPHILPPVPRPRWRRPPPPWPPPLSRRLSSIQPPEGGRILFISDAYDATRDDALCYQVRYDVDGSFCGTRCGTRSGTRGSCWKVKGAIMLSWTRGWGDHGSRMRKRSRWVPHAVCAKRGCAMSTSVSGTHGTTKPRASPLKRECPTPLKRECPTPRGARAKYVQRLPVSFTTRAACPYCPLATASGCSIASRHRVRTSKRPAFFRPPPFPPSPFLICLTDYGTRTFSTKPPEFKT